MIIELPFVISMEFAASKYCINWEEFGIPKDFFYKLKLGWILCQQKCVS